MTAAEARAITYASEEWHNVIKKIKQAAKKGQTQVTITEGMSLAVSRAIHSLGYHLRVMADYDLISW